MSSTVKQTGFLAIMRNPIVDHHSEAFEDMQEKLYEQGKHLEINAHGVIAIDFARSLSLDEREDFYGIHINGVSNLGTKEQFLEALKEAEVEIEEDSIRPFFCIYYNGADSYLWDVTPEEVRNS